MLQVKKLNVSLGGSRILSDIHFKLHKQKILGLIGPNGAGKTTLIRAINGSIEKLSGQLLFNDIDLVSLKPNERAKLITTVPQNRELPAGFTVEQIVMMGRTPYINMFGKMHDSDEKIIDDVMTKTRIKKFAHKQIEDLSGGEQQRVILAQAFAQDTPLLLLDEPTTHLDIRYQMEFLELLFKQVQHKKASVIIAMHDLNQTLRFCDEIILLSRGQIFASGKPQKVMTNKLLSKVYGYPITVKKDKKGVPEFINPRY